MAICRISSPGCCVAENRDAFVANCGGSQHGPGMLWYGSLASVAVNVHYFNLLLLLKYYPWYSGLMPNETMSALLLNGLANGVNVAVRHRAATKAFIAKLFATISSVKAAYAQLQFAQSPYDADGIQSADQLLAEIQKQKSLLKTYEITGKKLDSQLKLKDSEVTFLREKLEEVNRENKSNEKRLNSSGPLSVLDNLHLSGLSPNHKENYWHVKYREQSSSNAYRKRKMDMSTGQPGFTSPEQDSCTPFSFEESSTSPLMEDIDKDRIDVGDISANEMNNGNDGGNNENMENEKNDTQNEDADPHKHAFQRKPRKRTSTNWNDFEEIVDADGSKKAKCSYCLARSNMPSMGATTQFHRHLKRCTQRQLASKKQMVLSVEIVASESAGSIANFKYDRAKVRELASHMTLYHEYPFMQMEDVIFNKFMRANTAYWQKITRIAIKNDCISTYEIEKKKLKTLFKSINKVNITTDMWKSSNQKISYMVVTGHFIDSDWKLQKRVLNFFHVPPPHSGVIVANALQKCFIEWGIEDKVYAIIVDNSKYNDVALRVLKDNFTLKKKLSFGGKVFHVHCCAHIINLLVQDGIKEVKILVDIVREGVKYLITSDSRMIQFSDIAKQLQLSSKKLILDCPTSWNSTYMMLATALEFREVFPRYQDRDAGFIYVPTIEDWVKVEQVCDFLGIFNVVTNIISGIEYPTAN
ncbi:hypothetical protein F0562_019719 [Nyssa sinensis]|uniref:BED-type domain-containing protein n=1 Tax=Nyssa sinensis TaxID=561372 RepID=A0A5J5BSY3_9ASTE|nr:hypothetical protein F0562_019719 [Nyssa sinensis]